MRSRGAVGKSMCGLPWGKAPKSELGVAPVINASDVPATSPPTVSVEAVPRNVRRLSRVMFGCQKARRLYANSGRYASAESEIDAHAGVSVNSLQANIAHLCTSASWRLANRADGSRAIADIFLRRLSAHRDIPSPSVWRIPGHEKIPRRIGGDVRAGLRRRRQCGVGGNAHRISRCGVRIRPFAVGDGLYDRTNFWMPH